MKISDLKHDPNNMRKHGEANKDFIAKSIGSYGLNRPIVVDENGMVLSGNGVLEVAKAMGVEDIEVVESTGEEIIAVQVDHLTDVEKREYTIADNRAGELSEWDTDRLASFVREGGDVSSMFFDDELTEMMGTAWLPDEEQQVLGQMKEVVKKSAEAREIHMLTYICPHCYHEWTERKV